MGKMETFTWNSYMDSCLDVLERERECPRDEILVALVRIQLIAEEAQKLLRSDGNGHSSQGPTYIFKAGLLSRLGDLREGLPASLHSHCASTLPQTLPRASRPLTRRQIWCRCKYTMPRRKSTQSASSPTK